MVVVIVSACEYACSYETGINMHTSIQNYTFSILSTEGIFESVNVEKDKQEERERQKCQKAGVGEYMHYVCTHIYECTNTCTHVHVHVCLSITYMYARAL